MAEAMRRVLMETRQEDRQFLEPVGLFCALQRNVDFILHLIGAYKMGFRRDIVWVDLSL